MTRSIDASTEIVSISGIFLNKAGTLYRSSGKELVEAAKDVVDFGGVGGGVHWQHKRKPWVVNGVGFYGELEKLRDVLLKGTPLFLGQRDCNRSGRVTHRHFRLDRMILLSSRCPTTETTRNHAAHGDSPAVERWIVEWVCPAGKADYINSTPNRRITRFFERARDGRHSHA